MADFSVSFPADVSRIELPSDLDQSVTRVHTMLDSDKDGFLDDTELNRLQLHSLSGTDEKVAYLLRTASARLSDVSTDRRWLVEQRGVSLSDLKAIRQLDANRQLVKEGLLADLEFVFSQRDTHRPVTAARLLKQNLHEIDTSRDGNITRSEVESAMRSKSAETAAIAKMLNDHFLEISALGDSKNYISGSALRRFRYLLDPGDGLISRYTRVVAGEKDSSAGLVFTSVCFGFYGAAICYVGAVVPAVPIFAVAGLAAQQAYDKYRGGVGANGAYLFTLPEDEDDSAYFASENWSGNLRASRISSRRILTLHEADSASVRSWSHFRK